MALRPALISCLVTAVIFAQYLPGLASYHFQWNRPRLPRLTESVVNVPEDLRAVPFDVQRRLTIPDGFGIDVIARVQTPRLMLLLPNRDVLISCTQYYTLSGNVTLLRWNSTSRRYADRVTMYKDGLRRPHGLAFATIGDKRYVYVSESYRVARYEYNVGDLAAGDGQVVIDNLPDEVTTNSSYLHPLKSIAIKNGVLYLAIGTSANEDPKDLSETPARGAIHAFSLDGGNHRVMATAVRNAEGLSFAPDTGELWVVVNQRDDIKYPYNDSTGNYGKVIPDFVDGNPLEQFIRIRQGDSYGWPYCNPSAPNGTADMDNVVYVPDADRNPGGSALDCSRVTPTIKGMEAHTAPLGLSFWTGRRAPYGFRNGALVGLHGSWNRQTVNGNKLIFFPWRYGYPGEQYDLVSGWIVDPIQKTRWGRPVAAIPLPDGSILISDDYAGAIYRLYRK